jgi:hypothetical protein
MYIGCFVGINHNTAAATDAFSIRVISVQGSLYTPDYKLA